MKYSLCFIAFVVMAAVNVSALPAEAIKPTSEIDDIHNSEKYASSVGSPRPRGLDWTPPPEPFAPDPGSISDCDFCDKCSGKELGECLGKCLYWVKNKKRVHKPRGC